MHKGCVYLRMTKMDSSDQPVCWIIAGPNGAGKTTFALDYLPNVAKCANFVNADLIAAGLAPLAPDSKSFAAGRAFLREVKENILRRQDFGFETTLSGLMYRNLIGDLRSMGWRVEMLYLSLQSLDLARSRVAERVRHGGHGIPEEVLERRFFRSLNNFFDEYASLLNRAICYCNADDEPRLIFTQQCEHRTVYEPAVLKQLEKLKRNESV